MYMIHVVFKKIDAIKELVRMLEKKVGTIYLKLSLDVSEPDRQEPRGQEQMERSVSANHAVYMRLHLLEGTLVEIEKKLDAIYP
jgi:hypothetical protein